MAEVAARLEGVVEELTDIALDALRRGSQGDPHSAEAGEASRSSAASCGPDGRSRRLSPCWRRPEVRASTTGLDPDPRTLLTCSAR